MIRKQVNKQLQADIKRLDAECEINLAKLRKLKRILLKGGLVLDKALPLIMTSIIQATTYGKDRPLVFEQTTYDWYQVNVTSDDEVVYQKVEKKENTDSLKYVSAWKQNENGYYEQTTTVYEVSDTIDMNNIDEILTLSEEELKDLFIIKDFQTETKKELSETEKEEQGYLAMEVTLQDLENPHIEKDSIWKIILNIGKFQIIFFSIGASLFLIQKFVLKDCVRKRIIQMMALEEEMDTEYDGTEIFEQQQRNLALLEGESSEIQSEKKIRLVR